MNDKFFSNLLLQILALIFSSRAFSFKCHLSDPSNRVQSVVEFEQCDQNTISVFSNYKISNFPIVLTGLNGDFNLALVVKKGNIIGSFKLNKALVIENGLYDFHNPSSVYGNVNFQLVEPLSKIGVTEALVWNIGFNFPVEGTNLEAWGIKIHLILMTHEGFHFFGQQLNRIELSWPNQYLGLSEQARNETQKNVFC